MTNAHRFPSAVPALMAALVGIVYSFPNWWWRFTAPDYAVVRGYALSDDDVVPYAIGLDDSSDGRPITSAFLRTFETRDQAYFPSLSYWITNLLLGSLVRLTGSLETFVPIGLFLSGIATFLLFYALARQLLLSAALGAGAALFASFRYPFYVALVAGARHFVENGWRADPDSLIRLSFPGMVNAYQLYPYLRWPVPGMVYWWFLLSLYLVVRLAHSSEELSRSPSRRWPIVLAGALVGLSAFVYFYFWTFLLASLVVLAGTAWQAHQRELSRASLGALVVAVICSIPLFFIVGATLLRRSDFETTTGSVHLSFSSPTAVNFFLVLSTHGLTALAVLLVTWLTSQAGTAAVTPGAARDPALLLRNPASPPGALPLEATLLFSWHITVVLLAGVELLGFYFWAWHWARYVMDSIIPLTFGWIIARWARWQSAHRDERQPAALPLAGTTVWGTVWLALGLAGWQLGTMSLEAGVRVGLGLGLILPAIAIQAETGRRHAVVAAVALVTLGAWYFYHRTVNDMSWIAFLPLGLWLAGHKPKWATTAGITFLGLNLLLAVGLQGYVRPVRARAFFSLPKEYTEALKWLDENTEPDSVVATNGWQSEYLIRAYTHNLTLSAQSWWVPASPAEQQERYLLRSAIFQTKPEFLEQLLAENGQSVRTFKDNVNYYWIGDSRMDILSEKQATVLYNAEEYAALYAQPLESLLSIYRVDYVWVGPWEQYAGTRDFDQMSEVKRVFVNRLIEIYQVRQTGPRPDANR